MSQARPRWVDGGTTEVVMMTDWEHVLEKARAEWEKIEAEIADRVKSRIAREQLPRDEIEDLRKMEVPEPVDPHWIRPFFYRPILPAERLFFKTMDIHLHPELLIHSSRGWMVRVRRFLQPLLKLMVNLEAVLHRQSVFNEAQAAYDDRLAHHLRLLHQISNQLVAELTKLRLEFHELRHQVELLEEQLEWYKQRHRVVESWLTGELHPGGQGQKD